MAEILPTEIPTLATGAALCPVDWSMTDGINKGSSLTKIIFA